MTTTPIIPAPTAVAEPETTEPEFIEELFRNAGLKVLFWRVGDPYRADEDDPNTILLADLMVYFTNGRRPFFTSAILNLDVIYALVGTDTVAQGMCEVAIGTLIENAREVPEDLLELAEADDSYAQAIGTWQHTDGDLIRQAALAAPEGWGELLIACAEVVDTIPPGTSYASPKAQLAAVAARIAWDLL